jgi:hypothetical protein
LQGGASEGGLSEDELGAAICFEVSEGIGRSLEELMLALERRMKDEEETAWLMSEFRPGRSMV